MKKVVKRRTKIKAHYEARIDKNGVAHQVWVREHTRTTRHVDVPNNLLIINPNEEPA